MSLIYTAKSAETGGTRNSLYIGGRADAKSLEKLERFNITHILNVTPGKETSIQAGVPNFFEKHQNFKYKRIAVYDAPTSAPHLLEEASSIVQFVTSGLFHGSVLVHCQHGVSRSTTCALFYLMSKTDMSLDDAMKRIQLRRPQAQPIPAFMDILKQYEKEITCKKKRESSNRSEVGSKKRQRVVGPSFGPSIGPVGPQKPNPNDPLENAFKPGGTIGPSLPPTKNAPSVQKKKPVIIGPAMPPSKEETNSVKPGAVIGPAMPPKEV